MGQKSRIPSSHKNTIRTLRLIFLLSLIIFLVIFIITPKNDCETCKFDYGEKKLDFREAMKLYEEACLKGAFNGKKESIYINIDGIKINKTKNNDISYNKDITQLSWDNNSIITEKEMKGSFNTSF